MRKLLLLLATYGSMLGAIHTYASDSLTEKQKSEAVICGTIMTIAESLACLFVVPEVYKLVQMQLISVTGITNLSIGMGLGVGVVAFVGCSEAIKALLLAGNSKKMDREICRVNKEQKIFIASCGILTSMVCICNKIAEHIVKDL